MQPIETYLALAISIFLLIFVRHPATPKNLSFRNNLIQLKRIMPRTQRAANLKLPLEIRLMIYSLLLVSSKIIPIAYNRPACHGNKPELIKSPIPAGSGALLRVCSQIHEEAEKVLYESNTFAFCDIRNELPLFLTSISQRAYTLVRSLDLCCLYTSREARESLDLLTGCRGLKHLALRDVYKPIPKFLLSYLKGLRVESINFPDTIRGIRGHKEAREQMNSLKQIITNDKCPRTRGEKKRAAEQRDDKVGRPAYTIAIYSDPG
jgi:2EXR family